MNRQELNELAKQEYKNLEEHGYFEEIDIAEQRMKHNKNKSDLFFYQEIQDNITDVFGEIENTYGELSAKLETYIVERHLELAIQLAQNKEITVGGETIKLTATLLSSILSKLIKGEVSELYEVVCILESKIKRVTAALQTARNHTYSKKETEKEK